MTLHYVRMMEAAILFRDHLISGRIVLANQEQAIKTANLNVIKWIAVVTGVIFFRARR